MAAQSQEQPEGYQTVHAVSDGGHGTNKLSKKNKETKLASPNNSSDDYADTEGSSTEIEDTGENASMMEESNGSTSNDKKPLSTHRRLCLLGSLLLCVFTIFAFAFLLPCHRPSCAKGKKCPQGELDKLWTANFSDLRPTILKKIDINKDGKPDVLVGFSFSLENKRNSSIWSGNCKNSKCQAGLMAFNGCNGKALWNLGFTGSLGLLICQNQEDYENTLLGCLALEKKAKLLLLDPRNGKRKWSVNQMGNIQAIRTIRDINNDGIRDIVLIKKEPAMKVREKRSGDHTKGTTINILSGKSGSAIGEGLPIPNHINGSVFILVHYISPAKQFILLGSKVSTQPMGTLWVIEAKDLANRAENSWKGKRGTPWGSNRPDPQSGFIKLFVSTLVLTEPLISDLNGDGVKDIVVCTKEKRFTVRALNGKDAQLMWKRTLPTGTVDRTLSASIISNKGKLADVGVMVKFANQSSAVMVFSGQNGAVLWSFHVNKPLSVPPLGIPKTKGVPGGLLLWLPKSDVIGYLNGTALRSLDETDHEWSMDRGSQSKRTDEWQYELIIRHLRSKRDIRSEGESKEEKLHHLIKTLEGLLVDDIKDSGEHGKEIVKLLSKVVNKDSENEDIALGLLGELVKEGKYDDGSDDKNGGYDDEKDDIGTDVKSSNDGDDDSNQLTLDQKIDIIEKLKRILIQELQIHHSFSSADNNSIESSKKSSVHSERRSANFTPLQKILNEWRQRLERRAIASNKPSSTIPPSEIITKGAINDSTTPLFTEHTHTSQSVSSTGRKEEGPTSPNNQPSVTTKLDDSNPPSLCKACGEDRPAATAVLSAILVSKVDGHKVQVMEVAEERPLFLDPEQYKKQFGEGLLSPACIQLLPRLISTPEITDVDWDSGRVDMVYAVDYVTKPCPAETLVIKSRHAMKIRKVDISQALKKSEKIKHKEKIKHRGKKVAHQQQSHDDGNHKRNEIFESPFSQWNLS